jgi:hypothetical protein
MEFQGKTTEVWSASASPLATDLSMSIYLSMVWPTLSYTVSLLSTLINHVFNTVNVSFSRLISLSCHPTSLCCSSLPSLTVHCPLLLFQTTNLHLTMILYGNLFGRLKTSGPEARTDCHPGYHRITWGLARKCQI